MAIYSSTDIITYHEPDHPSPWAAPHNRAWQAYQASIASLQHDNLLITRHFFRAFASANGNYRLNVVLNDGRELRWDMTITWPGSTNANVLFHVDTIDGNFTSSDFGKFREFRASMVDLIIQCHITQWDRIFTY